MRQYRFRGGVGPPVETESRRRSSPGERERAGKPHGVRSCQVVKGRAAALATHAGARRRRPCLDMPEPTRVARAACGLSERWRVAAPSRKTMRASSTRLLTDRDTTDQTKNMPNINPTVRGRNS
eukprot:1231463-Prymnesium_polylepis.1